MRARETHTIRAQDVDSFILLQRAAKKCAFKGCRNSGKVKLFWGSTKGAQRHDFICINHALELANQVLGEYKFSE